MNKPYDLEEILSIKMSIIFLEISCGSVVQTVFFINVKN